VVALNQLLGPDALEFQAHLIVDSQVPIDVRRRSLQAAVASTAGVDSMLDLYREGQIPEDLLAEFTFLLRNHADELVREKAAAAIPLPEQDRGNLRHDLQAVLAMSADPERGRVIFHQNKNTVCSQCHRVQGEGHWVGPDLSSVGTKYGRKELLYHIINPSGAINYNYVSHLFQLDDGRVLSGLVVDRRDGRVVLKTATGERTIFSEDIIEEQQAQNISLMPRNLVAKLSGQELADLVDYLSTLRKPVSTATQYHLLGPLPEGSVAGQSIPELQSSPTGVDGGKVRWQRVTSESDGRLDLSAWLGSKAGRVVLCYLPVVSPSRQNARIVVNSESSVALWHDGDSVAMEHRQGDSSADSVSSGRLSLQRGVNHLVLQLSSGSDSAEITTTIISDRELSYSADVSATRRAK